MNRKILLLLPLISCHAAIQAQGDTLSYFDFADAIPNGWQSTDLNQSDFHWIHTYTGLEAAYNPATASTLSSATSSNGWLMFHAAFYNTDSLSGMPVNSALNMNSTVNSSAMDFSQEPNVHLSLSHYFRTLSSPTVGSLELGISTDSINWEVFDLHTGSDSPLNLVNGIEQISLDISSIAGNQEAVWIRFHFRNLAWHFWCIDDLLLSTSGLISSLDEELNFIHDNKLYPNPVINHVRIPQACSNTFYTIHTIEGKVIKKGKAQNAIDFSDIQPGIYLLQLDACKVSKKVFRVE